MFHLCHQVFFVDAAHNGNYEHEMTYETQTGPCNVPAHDWSIAKDWYGQNTLDEENKANELPEGKLLSSGIVKYMKWIHSCARQVFLVGVVSWMMWCLNTCAWQGRGRVDACGRLSSHASKG